MPLPEGVLLTDLPPGPPGVELEPPALAAQQVIGIARAAGRQRDEAEALATGSSLVDGGHFLEYPEFIEVQQQPMAVVTGQRLAIKAGFPDQKNALPTILNMIRRNNIMGRFGDTGISFRTVHSESRAESDAEGNRVYLAHTFVKTWLAEVLDKAGIADSAEEAELCNPFNPERQRMTTAVLGLGDDYGYGAIFGFPRDRDEAAEKRQAIWRGRLHHGALYGADPAKAPQTYQERDEYLAERASKGELKVGDAERYVAMRLCHDVDVPAWMAPFAKLIDPIVPNIAPRWTRELYGEDSEPKQGIRFHLALGVAYWMNIALRSKRLFPEGGDAWLFGLVDQTEQKRIDNNGGKIYIPSPLGELA